MKKTTISLVCFMTAFLSVNAQAQEAPPPRKMPRTPVEMQAQQAHDALPSSRQVQGLAAIIDGEKLRVGETDMRLFGIVPPQLAASFGPQARAELDALAGGQDVTCQIRDRDHDGRLLATCHNAKDSDMAFELLKRGLAVTARGSLSGTELAAPYMAAEQAAQAQRLGLWSTPMEAAATVAAPVPVAPPAAEPSRTASTAPASTQTSAQAAQAQERLAQEKTADIVAQNNKLQARLDDASWAQNKNTGFFERYQILIAGILMLATASAITAALWIDKRRDKIDEIRAIAAALRGELMAARSVCAGRVKSITNDAEDAAASWPRIRATLYQAYVGRLGLLGADLARQISSVYGQSSDYAGLYTQIGAPATTPKKQSLETLIKNIDAILPRLSRIEQAGMPWTNLSATNSGAPTTAPSNTGAMAHYPPQPPRPEPRIEPLMPRATMATSAAPVTTAAPATTAETTPEPQAASYSRIAATMSPTQSVMEPQYTQPAVQYSSQGPAMWEAVRGFINTTREALSSTVAAPPAEEPHVSEYTEMIEADMMRYRYDTATENLDISPQKKKM